MASATVLLGDWREVLPALPANAVVVTDPPFGVGRSFDDQRGMASHVVDVLRLIPARRYLIRASVPALLEPGLPTPARICAEVAELRIGQWQPHTVMYSWHPWLVYGRRRVTRTGGTTRDWCRVDPMDPGPTPPAKARRRHDGLTPWQAAEWALRTWVEPGSLVVDPYAGLATIGLRAVAAGLDYLGVERVPEYHDAAVRALEAQAAQLTLDW